MELVSRKDWGALAPKRVTRMFRPAAGWWLHHQAGADFGAPSVRQVQSQHMLGPMGAADIGYNWLYSPRTDKFYVGRGRDVVGAHTQGHNATTESLCVLGDWDRDVPSDVVIRRVAEFGRWRGIPLLGGHRDASGAATACPGRHLYGRLPEIRRLIDEEPDMAELSEEAQKFYQKQYELFQEQDVRPTTLPTLVAYYRHVRGWFVS